ncbi:kelch repeat-containing protein and HSP90-like ATPase [Cryptosporidium canis]|nr:kelch repeat-containing protein and HSP90-like ATPase [Cryptosporidium canis]
MEQVAAPRDQMKDQEENQVDTAEAQVYLENGTLLLIKDDGVALRRLDLERCSVMQLPSAPDFKLYYRTQTGDADEMAQRQLRVEIVAISKSLSREEESGDLDSVASSLREKLSRWNKELELRAEISLVQESIGVGSGRAKTRLPTLLDLLSVLCSDRITTGEQRQQIRDAVNLFLMGEIRYDDLFHIFAQILGDEVLQHLIASLEGPLKNDGSPDLSWMICSLDFKKEASPFEHLFSYASTQRFLQDSVRLYPLNGFDSEGVANVGYSSVRCGPYLIFLGGIRTSRREMGVRDVALYSFDQMSVLNTETLAVSSFRSTGPAPRSTIHHTSNLLVSQTGPKILLSGGLCWDEAGKEFRFSDTTSLFDMSSRTWTILDGCANTPRFLHSSLTYPQCPSDRPSQFVIVFGGLTKSLEEISPSNDLWVFSAKFNSWTQVAVLPAPNSTQTELPTPRFGHSMTWVNEKTFLVYGGETRERDGSGSYAGVLLNDVWLFTINSSDLDIENLNIRGHWTKRSTVGPDRPLSSLHASIALTFPRRQAGAEGVSELRLGCLGDSSYSNQLLFIGGCASPLVKRYPICLNDREPASEDCNNHQDWFLFGMQGSRFELDSTSAVQMSLLDISSNEWRSIGDLRVSSPSPTTKSILARLDEQDDFSDVTILGGTSLLFDTESTNKNTTIPCILLQMLGPSAGNPQARKRKFVALSLSGLEPYYSNAYTGPDERDRACSIQAESVAPETISRYLKPKPSKGFSISASAFSALRGAQSWIFGAIAHLADNSFSTEINSSLFEVSICRNYITVIDNGSGLDYAGLSKLLRHFGVDSDSSASPQSPSKSSSLKMYGLGFKHALSRLSETCMIFTKTSNAIGVGLISKAILESENILENRYWTPICYWYSDTMKPLIPQGSSLLEHQENQRLILQYGFVKDPSLFCDHFDSIDSCSGTKMVFGPNDKCLKLHPSQYLEVSETGINLLSQEGSLLDASGPGPCIFSIPTEDGLPQSPESASSLISPFWESERLSIDYCLATYLGWLYLNKTQRIFCQGRLLAPDDKSQSLSLYELLLQTLGNAAELSRIYKNGPNDGAFALIGRLRADPKVEADQDTAMTLESEGKEDAEKPPNSGSGPGPGPSPSVSGASQIRETGILLYYNGRLIRRMECVFPNARPDKTNEFQVTAVINVPQWLRPSGNKQEFALEGTGVFEEFQDHVQGIVSEYLAVQHDKDKLKEWEAEFNKPDREDPSLLRPSKIPKLEA